jgi:hypothetical protein
MLIASYSDDGSKTSTKQPVEAAYLYASAAPAQLVTYQMLAKLFGTGHKTVMLIAHQDALTA